ncbi:hypothetical protein A4X13_0g6724 [Tilletia indica]|uniref:Protein kinase regulator n=1 Tax=Tilletia indica TaxID=43049 RepID=A0A177TDM7_9BASI|nr:hypothetical protein A4X13_0g6724 [Tilletia indica]
MMLNGNSSSSAPTTTAAPAPSSPTIHVTEWSEAHVSQWLLSLGFAHLAPAFRDHGINGDSLVLLDDDNLQEIGVNSVGQRLSLLGEIYRLKETFEIPIEEGDYVPHSAYPSLALHPAPSESHLSVTNVLGLLQQRNDRISALESELSKVTIYLNRLQQDFTQICQLVGLNKPSSRDAPPIFPFSPLRSDAEPVLLLNPSERLPTAMGLSSSQQGMLMSGGGGYSGMPNVPMSANPLSTPVVTRAPPMSAPSLAGQAGAPLVTASHKKPSTTTTTTTGTNGDSNTPLSAVPPPQTAAAAASATATPLPGFGTSDPENTYRSFRVTLEDPCYRVLPAALKKYKINDDWKKYALIICHGNTERCVTYEEKPLLLFQKLKESKQNPIFMLRHIRDVKNPIALAKAKAEARKGSVGGATGLVKVPSKDTASEDTAASSKTTNTSAAALAKGNKVAQTVARFETSSPKLPPATTPTSEVGPPNSASATAPSTATTSNKKAGSGSGHTLVALGSREWAEAMAVRALKNGHEVGKPVLTGAATRLPASAPVASTSGTAAAVAGAEKKSGEGTGTAISPGQPPGSASSTSTSAVATNSPSPPLSRKYAIAIYPYPSERDDEFDVELGDTFVVLSKIYGWWAVERDPRADGEGDGQWVEVDSPAPVALAGDSEVGRKKVRVQVVRTGWVPAGCLLEMSKALAVAVPDVKGTIEGAKAVGTAVDEEGEKEKGGEGSSTKDLEGDDSKQSQQHQPHMATFPIPPSLITSPSTPGIMLMDYTSPPEDRLVLKRNDRLRVFKRYSHWSYCVQEGGSNGRGWVPSWYIGKASSASASGGTTTSSSSARRAGGSSRTALGSGRGTPSSASSRSGTPAASSSKKTNGSGSAGSGSGSVAVSEPAATGTGKGTAAVSAGTEGGGGVPASGAENVVGPDEKGGADDSIGSITSTSNGVKAMARGGSSTTLSGGAPLVSA